jgi:hypothetical protein
MYPKDSINRAIEAAWKEEPCRKGRRTMKILLMEMVAMAILVGSIFWVMGAGSPPPALTMDSWESGNTTIHDVLANFDEDRPAAPGERLDSAEEQIEDQR